MTPAELARWLGLKEGAKVPADLAAEMADVPFPDGDYAQIAVFGRFLTACAKLGIKPS